MSLRSGRTPIGPGRGLACGRVPSSFVLAPPFAGMAFYYDSREFNGVTVGTQVATWTDLTGNGVTLTNASGVTRPTIVAGTKGPLLNFNGSQFLASATEAYLGSGPFTVFAIGACVATASQRVLVSIGDSVVTSGFAVGVRNSANSFVVENVGTFDGVPFVANAIQLITIVRDGDGAGAGGVANFSFYEDGVLDMSYARTYFPVTAGKVTAGRRPNTVAPWSGKGGAIGGFSGVPTAPQLAALATLTTAFV